MTSMLNPKQTTIMMSEETRRKIDALIDKGHSATMSGIIDLAIDRMFREEVRFKRVNDVTKPKAWGVVFEK